MKKSLVSALTTALVVGAASTTFAAANPFADVAADHWAYDAIAQLSADGVIEGYGDGTYRGDQEITRYEVAQIVARAMAKEGVSAANKAMIDKLAAEFASELNSLGVRVAALEKKVDNVKWTGRLRYRYSDKHLEDGGKERHRDNLLMRLEPKATVNAHWFVQSRLDVYSGGENMKTAANENATTVDRAWAQGQYGKTTIKLGKFNVVSADNGMVFNQRISGAEVTTGNKLKVDLFAGRVNNTNADVFGRPFGSRATDAASIQGIQVYNDPASKITAGASYIQLAEQDVDGDGVIDYNKSKIFAIGAGYKFDKNFKVYGGWSHNSINDIQTGKSSHEIMLQYKQMSAAKKGSFDVFAGYRNVSQFGTIHSSAFEKNGLTNNGEKFWEIGVDYCLDKNIVALVDYVNGKKTADNIARRHFNGVLCELNFLF